MQILHEHGFPVPTPIDQARHTIVMSFEEAYPLRQIAALPVDQIRKLYAALMNLIVRLARAGLIHGDFNEFNLLVREIHPESECEDEAVSHAEPVEKIQLEETPDVEVEHGKGYERIVSLPEPELEEDDDSDSVDDDAIAFEDGIQVEPVLIDFPQMVSIQHPNAEYYFARDVECVRRFFRKRFRFESDEYPTFEQVMKTIEEDDAEAVRLDALARASGFGKVTDADAVLESVCNKGMADNSTLGGCMYERTRTLAM